LLSEASKKKDGFQSSNVHKRKKIKEKFDCFRQSGSAGRQMLLRQHCQGGEAQHSA